MQIPGIGRRRRVVWAASCNSLLVRRQVAGVYWLRGGWTHGWAKRMRRHVLQPVHYQRSVAPIPTHLYGTEDTSCQCHMKVNRLSDTGVMRELE